MDTDQNLAAFVDSKRTTVAKTRHLKKPVLKVKPGPVSHKKPGVKYASVAAEIKDDVKNRLLVAIGPTGKYFGQTQAEVIETALGAYLK